MRSALWLVVLLGCGPADDADDPDDDVVLDDCANHTWQTVGGPFTRTWCSGCHSSALKEGRRGGAPLSMNLDSEQAVLDNLALFATFSLVGDAPAMPPGGGPTEVQLVDLQVWVDCVTP